MAAHTTPISPEALAPYCETRQFAAGEVLCRQGHRHKDMYLIAEGQVAVRIAGNCSSVREIVCGPGSPIGEIGFLIGCPATASATAKTSVAGLVIDDTTLWRLEKENSSLAIGLLRFLGEISQERLAFNTALFSDQSKLFGTKTIEVHLCCNDQMLEQAARLRYQVYCEELGRTSPYADHDRRTIRDNLDEFGHTFIAMEDGEVIGTIRGNRPIEGSLGVLTELYGMAASPFYPDETAIVTKLIVVKPKRGGPAALSLVAALTRFGMPLKVRECYIDCVPALLHYYRAMGFRPSGQPFFHYENGTSVPMMTDLHKTGRKLRRVPDTRQLLEIYLKARMLKWMERFRPTRYS